VLFDVYEDGDVTVIGFKNRRILDEPSAQLVGKEILSLVDQPGRKAFVVNFRNVEYLTSATLGLLITLHKKVSAAGGRLSFCNLNPRIHEVLVITRLDRMFRIDPDPGKEGPGDNTGGVKARVNPPKPSSGGAVALKPPAPEPEG
jgi:anti-sigma B factor antagonist